MPHVGVKHVAAEVARAVQRFLEMPVAWVKVMGFGGEAPDKVIWQAGAEKAFGFLDDAFGDPFGDEAGVVF